MLVTVVVTAHREGRYLTASLRSAEAALSEAGLDHDSAEIILVLDRPDQDTMDVADAYVGSVSRRLVVDVGDCGLARNEAVAVARGRFVALLDGDDLWGHDWIRRGLEFSDEHADSILHAQVMVAFDAESHCWQSPDMASPGFRLSQVLFDNCWTSLAMASTELFRRFPYQSAEGYSTFGYEDWAWNCETIANGIQHHVVPQTVHFVRRRSSSLSRASASARVLAIPNSLTPERVRELTGWSST